MKKAQEVAEKESVKSSKTILTRGESIVFALCLLLIAACIFYCLFTVEGPSETVIVYKTSSHISDADSAASSAGTDKINVNTDGIDRLTQLTGIGEVRAQAIMDYRILNGEFTCAEDLLRVDGIGEKTLDKIRDQICF